MLKIRRFLELKFPVSQIFDPEWADKYVLNTL